jgi:hypothetical protein
MKRLKDPRTISDWTKVFHDLYSSADLKRSPEQIWVGTMAYCSQIGEAIRRVDFLDLLKYAAHAFCWMCSYVNKCNQLKDDIFSFNDCLSGMVSLKYPLKCGHCKSSPCKCSPEEMDRIEDKAAHYEALLKERRKTNFKIFTISQWQETFREIYSGKVHILTLDGVGFHFLEEAGEEALAVRMLSQLRRVVDEGIKGVDKGFFNKVSTVEGIVENYKRTKKVKINYTSKDPKMLQARIVDAKMRIVIEAADTFSWFCSILNKLQSISEENQINLNSLEKTLEEEYFDEKGNVRCPTCKKNPCSCIFFC